MNADFALSRRALLRGLPLLALPPGQSLAQGYAGLGESADGFAQVSPGRPLRFPADHGAHPDFRIEWWYVTANLAGDDGRPYGAQWTLFRQAMTTGPDHEGWSSRQIWMGHAAVTSAETHRFSETFARGGIGQAGVAIAPFRAWIDAWDISGRDSFSDLALAPLDLNAAAADFSVALRLDAERPLVLQGDAGYSRKSDRGQASYYYSQPWFRAAGTLTLGERRVPVQGRAWLDREWSSQPLAADQTGWDWFALHLDSGTKLMLYRLRQRDGDPYLAANWIDAGGSTLLSRGAAVATPLATTRVAGRDVPTRWRIVVGDRGVDVTVTPVNAQSWMGTRFPYWEGPITLAGSHSGDGYLEMTGY